MGATERQLWRRLGLWARRHRLQRRLVWVLTLAVLASTIATYVAFTDLGPLGTDTDLVLILLNVNMVLFLALGALVARRVIRVWTQRRSGSAGSKLHVRLAVLFGAVAVTPTILVTVFSTLFFNVGLEAWFSDKVRTAIQASNAVAEEYLREHKQVIAGDVLAMAQDLNRRFITLPRGEVLDRVLTTQASQRGLTEAVIFNSQGQVLARYGYTMTLQFEEVPYWALEKASRGEVAVVTTQTEDRVRGLVLLDGFESLFLYVGRFVDPDVLRHLERTQRAVAAYEALEGRRFGMEVTLSLIFMLVGLLLLLASVWVGLIIANRLARPIVSLIDASERVGEGDLDARVDVDQSSDEMGVLSRAFNRMTGQLSAQRRSLMEANRELDERRRFTETVLTGVSAGVIGLDPDGCIQIPNRSAVELLHWTPAEVGGRPLAEVAPELAAALEAVREKPERMVQEEVRLTLDGRPRVLLVRVAAERLDDEVLGYVVTFDDITELQAAQRKAAWADVARRIAHEIKNPLTPIQLSAERLKRKYLKQIHTDPEAFISCTDTIVRQVDDMRRMVNEFSEFARLPAPQMETADLGRVVKRAVDLQRQAGYAGVRFETDLPDTPLPRVIDPRQMDRALTNLLKNAVEALENGGTVAVRLERGPAATRIVIEDDGRGLPEDRREQLTEPYVTTREKGTGLGLAIVKKIMEDHGGDLILENREEAGARITLTLPDTLAPETQQTASGNRKKAAHGA